MGAGTIGAFVKDSKNQYMLSCNHVLANSDRGFIDDPIVHPSRNDADDVFIVGRLHDWIPLGQAKVDAAIARVLKPAVGVDALMYPGIGRIEPDVTQNRASIKNVIKLGRTTGVTTGKVSAIHLDQAVMNYGGGRFVIFHDQIEIVSDDSEPFSKKGDSGAVIIDRDTNQACGLLFGGDRGDEGVDRTWAHFLPEVLTALGVELAT